MKIELVCPICKASLAISEISPEDCVRIPNACVQIESPLCKDCANRYMYTNGTMKEELASVSFSNHENQLG
jgi:transposase-like protein